MTVVAVAAPFRVQRFDDAAGQDQADEGQQKQAHDDFLRLDYGRWFGGGLLDNGCRNCIDNNGWRCSRRCDC